MIETKRRQLLQQSALEEKQKRVQLQATRRERVISWKFKWNAMGYVFTCKKQQLYIYMDIYI
jgi:hypothetical protein